MLHADQGDFVEARPLLEEALAARRRVLGARHKDTVGSLNNLGMVLADQGDYAGARPLMEEAVEIRRQVLGDDHPDTATVLFNLSLVRRDQGDYLAARPGFEKALATWRRALGADHPHTTAVLRQLGRFHWEFGDYAAALPILEEALAAQRRIVGSIQTGEGTLSTGAPSIAECLGLLVQVHLDAGDYSAARPLMEEALEIDRRVLGSDNARTAVSLAELGRFYAAQSDSAAAVPFCEEALAIFRRTRGNDDRNRCSTLSLLGTLYLDMGEYTAARSLFEEAIAISRRSRPESYMRANDLNNLGAWHNKRGNYDEARLLLEEALALYRRVLGTDHRLTVIALSNLATTQVATGEDRAALTTLEKSLRMQGRMIPRMLEVGSERQRIAYLEGMHGVLDFFLSLVRSRFSSDPDAVRSALDRVLRRKGLLAEAQHAQRDEILGKRHPHLREQLSQLTAVRMQAARKHLAGPGPEGIEQHQRLVADWDEKREELERALVREIPEMNLGRRLDAVDHQAIAMALPEESALVEFVRFRVVDLEAIPLPPKLQSKPERYVAFLVRAGQPDAVEMVDLGEAAPIDALVATFRLAMTGDTGGGVTPTDTGAGAVHIEAQLRKALVDPILVQCPDLRAAGRNSGPRPLILAPDGELTQLPFEVLLFEDGHRLIDDYQMSYLSTGRDLLRANDLGGQPGAPIIAGDPQFDLGTAASERDTASAATRLSRDLDRGIRLAPLPGTREEATAIAVQLGVDPWLQHTVLEAELKESAEAKIQAFIEMLGADARLLTEGEDVKSHDLFVRLNSRQTITGEDGEEESELEYLTEIRRIRDEEPDLFERIKRLPKKARSTRSAEALSAGLVARLPTLLSYFRKGKLDKFYLSGTAGETKELDFFTTVKVLKPVDAAEARRAIPEAFYALLEHNKKAFIAATTEDAEVVSSRSISRGNDSYILKRLKAKEIKRCKVFTDDDEAFIQHVMRLLEDGALPKQTTKKVADALKKGAVDPLKVLGVLRRNIPRQFFEMRSGLARHSVSPREVILSSFVS